VSDRRLVVLLRKWLPKDQKLALAWLLFFTWVGVFLYLGWQTFEIHRLEEASDAAYDRGYRDGFVISEGCERLCEIDGVVHE